MLMSMLLGAIATTGPVPMPLSVDGNATIVHLVNRSEIVTVTAGVDGPLYSATTKEGKVLVSGATLEQLREAHPDIYKRLHPAITVAADAAPIGYAGIGD
jgi:hypothetical protein